jgi:DNA-binding transcriptional LysR family regulator
MQKQDWELLCSLYELKSLSKASDALYLSQPTLTRRLKMIEDEMGTTISYRSSKGLTFTPHGEQLVTYAQEMLRQYNKMKIALQTDDMIYGVLQIASCLSQTRYFLPELLQRFKKANPDITFEVQSMLSHDNAHALNTRNAQVAFFNGTYLGAFEKQLLNTHNVYIVHTQPFSLQDLPTMPYISYQIDHSTEETLEHWWYDCFECTPYVTMNVRDANIAYEMMSHELGYAIFLNTEYWEFNKNLYYMQVFFRDGTPLTRSSWVGYRQESLELANVNAFVDFTKRYAAEQAAKQPLLERQNF